MGRQLHPYAYGPQSAQDSHEQNCTFPGGLETTDFFGHQVDPSTRTVFRIRALILVQPCQSLGSDHERISGQLLPMSARSEDPQTQERYVASGARIAVAIVPPYADQLIQMNAAFILYRQHWQASVVAQHPGLANPEISKIIGEQWRKLPQDTKDTWKALAEVSEIYHLGSVEHSLLT